MRSDDIVNVFLDPPGYSRLAVKHSIRGLVDRLLVVPASAKRMAFLFGNDGTVTELSARMQSGSCVLVWRKTVVWRRR